MTPMAFLYGFCVLILSCATAWLFSRLRNGRSRRRPRLSRQEMRALRKFQALETPTAWQRLGRAIRERTLTFEQALRLEGMEKARRSQGTPAGQRTSGQPWPESRPASQIADETLPPTTSTGNMEGRFS